MTAYHVSRNGKTLGVYPQADAKDYYAQGRIAPHDLVWSEGMPAWLAASEVFGPGPQPQFSSEPPAPSPTPAFAPAPVVLAGEPASNTTTAPLPPKLHWALVLLFTLLTFGIFFVVWLFVQAAWVKKLDPKSNAMTLMVIYLVLVLIGQTISGASDKESAEAAAGAMLVLIGSVVSIVGIFSMRRSMLDHYNRVEAIGLRLSGVLTFFLGIFYLQHHMTRIASWKATGVLTPQ